MAYGGLVSTSVESPRRRMSGLRISGLVISALAVVIGVVCVVKSVAAVAAPLADAMGATPHQTPYSDVLRLDPGSYTVFERLEEGDAFDGPDSYRAPTFTTADVVVQSDAGGRLSVSSPGLTETVDQGSAHYEGFARFEVTKAGSYRVAVGADRPGGAPSPSIIVAPSLGSGLSAAGGWLAGVGASGLALLLGLGLLLASFLRGRSAPAAPATPYGAPASGGPPYGGPAYGAAQQPPPVAVPPGWYPDPHAPHLLRYWDGSAWSAHTHPRG